MLKNISGICFMGFIILGKGFCCDVMSFDTKECQEAVPSFAPITLVESDPFATIYASESFADLFNPQD